MNTLQIRKLTYQNFIFTFSFEILTETKSRSDNIIITDSDSPWLRSMPLMPEVPGSSQSSEIFFFQLAIGN